MRLLWPLMCLAPAVASAEILEASYVTPTDIYAHGAVGGGEYAELVIETTSGDRRFSLPHAIFEDTAPRLADLDGDGSPEVVTVASDLDRGASVQIWAEAGGEITTTRATAPIGQRHRWLAIAGIADLDGNGLLDIAYVDRPHLAKVLRVIEVARVDGAWQVEEKAALEGLTNHRIGEASISGGIRDCGQGPEVVTVNSDWSRLMVTGFDAGYAARDIGAYRGPESLTAALACES